jgi:hypothetical protein
MEMLLKKLETLEAKIDALEGSGFVPLPSSAGLYPKLSISAKDRVIFEREVSKNVWVDTDAECLKGIFNNLSAYTQPSTNSKYDDAEKIAIHVYSEGSNYSIRVGAKSVFARIFILTILNLPEEPLKSPIYIGGRKGDEDPKVVIPLLFDSQKTPLSYRDDRHKDEIKSDWKRNSSEYIEQAIARIRKIHTTFDPFAKPEDIVPLLVDKAKQVWGMENFKAKGAEYSARHFNGARVNELSIPQLQQYLKGLNQMQEQQKSA